MKRIESWSPSYCSLIVEINDAAARVVTDRQTDTPTDRESDRQTDRQTDRQSRYCNPPAHACRGLIIIFAN